MGDYSIPDTNYNYRLQPPGPIKAMNFYDSDAGMIIGVQPFWCLEDDPNDFYGCTYPEIWKMTSGGIAGLFLVALALSVLVAVRKNPFKKITVGASEPRMLMAPREEDIEQLQIVILQ